MGDTENHEGDVWCPICEEWVAKGAVMAHLGQWHG